MDHRTYIGLDVHARSITAAAFFPSTGEVILKTMSSSPCGLAEWIQECFIDPICTYEAGCMGFGLARFLLANEIECIVAAPSKLGYPYGDKRKKTDRNDAIFLAKALASNTVVPAFIPNEQTEALRNLTRFQKHTVSDLGNAKRRLNSFLLAHDYVYDDPSHLWSAHHRSWLRSLKFKSEEDAFVFNHLLNDVLRLWQQKTDAINQLNVVAAKAEWRPMVNALTGLNGIGVVSALSLIAEVSTFSRFDSVKSFERWCALSPSEHSSGKHVSRGSIDKAGNIHVHDVLINAAKHWHDSSTKRSEKELAVEEPIRTAIIEHNERIATFRDHLSNDLHKHAKVVTKAVARKLAGAVLSVGQMVERV